MIWTTRDDFGNTVDVAIIHGTQARGIGYADGAPVFLDGGAIVPAPHPGEKWMWGDGTGQYWTVVTCPGRPPYWVETKPHGVGSGWKLI